MQSATQTPVIESRRAAAPSHLKLVPPSGLTQEIFESATAIDADAWDQVRDPTDAFLDIRLLQAVEASMGQTCRLRYVLFRDADGVPAAITVLCTFTIDIGVLADDDWSRKALGWLRGISRKLVDYRILFCGLPVSAGQSSLRFAPGADVPGIMQLLDQTLQRFARKDRTSVIVLKEFEDHELSALDALEEYGYRRADSLPMNYVALKGRSYDQYLADLGHKKRVQIKQSIKRCAERGVEIFTTSDPDLIDRLFTPEVHRLYEAVLNRSKTQLEHLPREFFTELCRRLPDCCEMTFAMEGETVRGFGLSLRTGDQYRPMFAGVDYQINREVHLYFNLLFRSISDAAVHGSSVVELGQNADDLKRTKLGAQQTRRSIYVRGCGMAMNWIIHRLFDQLFPSRPLLGAETVGMPAQFRKSA